MNQKLNIIERKFDSMININTTFQNKIEFDIHFIQHYLLERRLIFSAWRAERSGFGVRGRVSGVGGRGRGTLSAGGCRVSGVVGGRGSGLAGGGRGGGTVSAVRGLGKPISNVNQYK
jgi:hypothetical protein